MNSLRNKIDKLKPHFTEGGKFSKLRSVFEGFESFCLFLTGLLSKDPTSATVLI